MLCNNYSLEYGHSWLTDSLAEELAGNNYMEVIFLDWAGRHKQYTLIRKNSVIIHVLPTDFYFFRGRLGKAIKWLFASRIYYFSIRKYLLKNNYDLIINFSPAMVMHPIYKSLIKKVKKSYLVLWDFFPIYHAQLGLVPPILTSILKNIETRACNGYQRIGLMSPKNLDYFRKHYVVGPHTSPEVLYLWGPNSVQHRDKKGYEAARKLEGIRDQLVCVFGGQLIKGRGIDKLIELAIYSKHKDIDAVFYIFGDGPERNSILDDMKTSGVSDIVIYKGFKPREEYLNFLKGADLGLVFNSGHVSVPTFPSKAIDYLRAAVPILAYVEDVTDFGEILEGKIKGGWSASPKSHSKLYSAFEHAYHLPTDQLFKIGSTGQDWYIEHLKVQEAARRLVGGQS